MVGRELEELLGTPLVWAPGVKGRGGHADRGGIDAFDDDRVGLA